MPAQVPSLGGPVYHELYHQAQQWLKSRQSTSYPCIPDGGGK